MATDGKCKTRQNIFVKHKPPLLRPVHIRDPINPHSLPLWKNGRIGNERALIGESVCWSKIQRGLVGPALIGRGERDEFFNRLKNGRGWSRSSQVVCWAGVQRGGRRYSVGWSYFDRVWSAIQRKYKCRSGLSGLKARSQQRPDQPPLSPALEKWTDRQWAGLDRGERMLV